MSESLFVQEFSRCISIPNLDLFVTEYLSIGFSLDEPEQLLGKASPKDILRCQDWEALIQIEAHLITKLSINTRASPIIFKLTISDDVVDHLKVLHLWVFWVLTH